MDRSYAVTDLKAAFSTLMADLNHAADSAQKDDSQYARRVYVRSAFALIEGVSYAFRQVTLASLKETGVLSIAETALLSESRFDLNRKGKPKETEQFLRFPESLVFSLESYAKSHGATFEVDKSCRGWQFMQAATQVRNRVTHPKSPESLEVTDDDKRAVVEAVAWWQELVAQLLKCCDKADACFRGLSGEGS